MPVQRRRFTPVSNPGFSPHPELLRQSRTRVANHWRRYGWSLASRVGGGLASLAAAGAANYFSRVPKLDTSPHMPRMPKRSRGDAVTSGQRQLPRKQGTSKDPSGSYVQLRKNSARAGAKLGNFTSVSKLLHAHSAAVIDRFQNVTNINDGSGAYPLSYNGDAGTRYFPYYLFDLTAVRNRWGDSAFSADPYPFYRLRRNVATGNYFFDVINGKTNANADSLTWQNERSPATALSDAKERAFLEWFDIKMVLYGATACPTFVDLAVVQFTEEEMTPLMKASVNAVETVIEPDASSATAGTAPNNRWNSAWQGTVDNLVGSTICQRNLKEISQFHKVKFQKRFTFNPTGTETDPSGHQVQFQFKYLMNKVCDYVQNPNEFDEVPVANEGNPNYWPAFDAHAFSPIPANKGREFLVIKAFTPDYNPTSVPGKCASFDMMIRRKRTIIRS